MGDWRTEPLECIAEIRSSNVDKKSNPGEEPVRLCNYMDVYSRDYITGDIEFMEATATRAEIQRFGIERGDVMITKDSETPDDIGIPSVVVDDVPGLVCGYHLALIKPNRGEVDSIYLAKQLALSDTARYYGRLANGSTRYGLSYQSIARTPIRLAPLPLQQRIAEILSTVDKAIEQTEALIAKTQQIKAGLMHDLFTRGVTADGQLRPPREEAPQLYKESPLGWIPKEWDYATLNDLVNPSRPIVYGILMPGQGHPGGIPVIKVKDVIDGEVRAGNLLLTSPQIDANYQRSKVRPRDILLTIRGTVGRLAQVPPFLDGANITQDTARIAIAAGLPEFYRYYLETPCPRRHFDINTLGQAVQGINLRDVRTTPVPVVPDDEQLKIAERVASIVSSERTEREHLAKLTQAKQGLMQDLLTGRVPATVGSATEPMDVAADV